MYEPIGRIKINDEVHHLYWASRYPGELLYYWKVVANSRGEKTNYWILANDDLRERHPSRNFWEYTIPAHCCQEVNFNWWEKIE